MCNCLSDQQPIIMCQCHETLFVMCCCRLLPWRRGSSKVRVYTLSIIMRLTGTIFAFLQCLKLVCLMFQQAVVAPALIFWSSFNTLIKLFCCCCSCRAQDRACLKFKLPTEMLHYPEQDYVDDEELVSSSSPAATMIRSASALGLATQVINPGCIFSQDLWMQRICTSYCNDHACQYDDSSSSSSSCCWCCCRGKHWTMRNLHNSFELRAGIATKQWRHQNVRLLYFRPSFYRLELIWFASWVWCLV